MIAFVREFLITLSLCLLLAVGLNWLMEKPHILSGANIILSVVCTLTFMWVGYETKRRAQ
jgi:Flp pilus assembly protein TadB